MIFKFKVNFQKELIRDAFSVLANKDKKRLFLITILQTLLGILDLLGVLLIGLISVISLNGIRSLPPESNIRSFLVAFGIDNFSFQKQVAVLGAIATLLLVTRTLLSLFFSRKILNYLSRKAALLSSELISKLLSKDLLTLHQRSSQENLYSVTTGVNILYLTLIASILALFTDLFLMIILFIGILSVDKIMAVITLVLFISVSIALYYRVQKRISFLSESIVSLTIETNEKFLEAINSFRELFVRNRLSFYRSYLKDLRLKQANSSAELAFIPNLSKYAIEITLVLGSVGICAIQFMIKDASGAITALSVFLAASSRMAPAVLRIQSSFIAIKSCFGSVDRVLNLIKSLDGRDSEIEFSQVPLDLEHNGFDPRIILNSVNYTYPGNVIPTIIEASLEVNPGEVIALVGPSGSGKSTLIDLMLGILKPNSGAIEISGVSPLQAINAWPGAISYVPQETRIISNSIKGNVAMGFPVNEQINPAVIDALRIAQLESVLYENNLNLDSNVGEAGSKLSGGQKQRLGIARALYLKPKLIVLDEATSSLDGQTESDLSEAIYSLRGEVTVILIAHRLSTVKKSDKIVYIEGGKILSIGSFEEIKSRIPNFQTQATLMGL
jgi:ABC-type bacteriocin/lantibiotic exporter with double-glycine peptidase domain